jgi:hypothetical protein
VKVQVRDAERNLRSYFRVLVVRAVSKPRTDAARWCAGRSSKYWLIAPALPKSDGHRRERTSRQSSLSNVCLLLFCVFVWPTFIVAPLLQRSKAWKAEEYNKAEGSCLKCTCVPYRLLIHDTPGVWKR